MLDCIEGSDTSPSRRTVPVSVVHFNAPVSRLTIAMRSLMPDPLTRFRLSFWRARFSIGERLKSADELRKSVPTGFQALVEP